ncbi:GNAT family N-acetyltransferase [Natronosporangium hydrolyticum]|uniref:GNAT family N-acetyltransferase n=1 Tax=Natronosporangium hydrolyticum TaxID=2811111 RepID=A0A895YJL6_9ACTN|nr:GNAT family N-acetyltransferase [Natronosporangium hydrolyticum]QSB13978.1 GNAT family N-acetyltransferase [Natronosporangium hydrolyticum]
MDDKGEFTVGLANLADWQIVTEWGNGEGWNIGFQDPACFLPTDPDGFFIGRLDGRPVSAVSLVNYSDDYAVWGHYLVDPQQRGGGYGLGVCKVASPHSGDRVTAGDAMPEQVKNYSRDGSVPVHDTIHFVGALDRPGSLPPEVIRIGPEQLDEVADYDRQCFPAYRREFLRRWLTAEGHQGYARIVDGALTGFGVVRPAPAGHRIGPLCADTPRDAEALFDALTAGLVAGDQVSIFSPDTQPAAAKLFQERGLTEQFRVVRMYRGPVPQLRTDALYGIGSLELG